ncbi:DUF4957 domain-containing protein [Flavobacterium sp. GSA192]|uniref:DUF4957 domain-containing protein n=1 Tax=Flavobacterium sp. GSA192 TaxID=2576304 RepID=UPI00112649B5|nr:DUF4957 domain-containing protein [Flavobacterium sp. GSA192]
MKKFIVKIFLASLFVVGTLMSCTGYNEDVIDMLEVNRAFAPVELTATIRTQTTVELNWTPRDNVDHYVVEFSADDPNFTTIVKSLEVSASELPLRVQMEGETVYSIRVKAIVNGLEDSNWTTVTATTLTEQIFTGIVDGDILGTQATLRWTPNSNVTQIKLSPGDITHVITAQEKINGMATITGLSGETAYTATLYNGIKIRGVLNFTTGVDVGDATLIKPTDDLFQKIADAASGAVLVLEPGDYTAQKGVITLSKSITLRGLRSFDKPKLKNGFLINTGAANISLIDLDLEGDGPTIDSNNDVVKYNQAGNYTSLLISGCTIRNFRKALIYGDLDNSVVNSVTVENSVVTDMWCNGSDFIDFRKMNVLNLTVKTSTFNNCAAVTSAERDFIRIDAAGASGTGLTTNVLLENCTIHKVSNIASRRILYVRFLNNALTVRKTLFANTAAIYSNQANTANPTFLSNNYFNSTGLHTTATKFDNSGTFTLLDPGFTNTATGDFTISNQTLKDNQIGDPRWIK